MKVARWGHALAVRLPAELIAELGIVEGDEITLVPRRGALEVAFAQRHERAVEWIREPQQPESLLDWMQLSELLEGNEPSPSSPVLETDRP